MDKLQKLLIYYIREELYEKAAEVSQLIAQQNEEAKSPENCEIKK